MTRYIRLGFLTVLGLVLLVLALANRAPVTLRLLPESLGAFMPFPTTLTLPLFLVLFGFIALGLLIGFFWEWVREHKYRAEAARQRRAAESLEREVQSLKGPRAKDGDDVLALLE